MGKAYVHGYDSRENRRLKDQANTLVELLHSDTSYPAGSRILEVGCGVGAQTVTLARNSPDASFLSIDISEKSIIEAREALEKCGLKNVQFFCADIFNFDIDTEPFDHVFVCHVLEHLSQPEKALSILQNLIKVGGTITVIEGDHRSTYFYPDSEEAKKVIQCQVELQNRAGGNASNLLLTIITSFYVVLSLLIVMATISIIFTFRYAKYSNTIFKLLMSLGRT